MKLPATEPLCSNNINSVLAKNRRKVEPIERQTASELALDFTRDSPDIRQTTIYLNSQPVDLSLAETISAELFQPKNR